MFKRFSLLLILIFAAALPCVAQADRAILGVKLQPDVRKIADEIELKTKKKMIAVFDEFEDDFTLGSSFIGEDDGIAYIRVNTSLRRDKRLEAVIVHEMLHLRLRVNKFPVFLFSTKVKTVKGLAQDVEQPNINALLSLIEHRVFKSEMVRFGLLELVDLAGDTEREAIRNRGRESSQADSINFARAVLEYGKPDDVRRLREVYLKNGWKRSITEGDAIAGFILTNPTTPEAVTAVFKKCLVKLYPTPRPLLLVPDKTVRTYQQRLITY